LRKKKKKKTKKKRKKKKEKLQHCSIAQRCLFKQNKHKKRYGALQLSCSSTKEVEGDGTAVAFFFFFRCKKKGNSSVAVVAFFAEEEEEEEEVAALQRSAAMPLQTKQTQKKGKHLT
jgi:hypothetical protein